MTVLCETNDKINIPKECKIVRECVEVGTDYEVTFKEFSRWDDKINGEITIQNFSDDRIEDWKLELETNLVFSQIWNAKVLEEEDYYCYLDNLNYNANIPANGSVTFGFIAECSGEPEIAEYYLYAMEEPLSQEEIIEYELEEGEIREEEDFATEEEYRAYNIIRSYYANKSAISAYGAKKKTNANFAKPVNKPIKTSPLGKNNIQYKITKLKRNLAIQAYTLVGNELYVTQRNGETVYLTRCILSNKKKKTYIAKNEMKLVGFAHGQTLEAFVYDGETYLLVGANSQYGFARSIAFLKFNKTKNSKIVYGKDEYKKDYYEITKLTYANQKNKYFGTVRRIDAALSNDNKTLGVWTVVGAMTTDDEGKKRIVFKKIQIGCFKFKKILSYFEKHSKQRSLSFKSMKKNEGWCYYSCEQNKKSQFIRPGGSNQEIEVSNRYYVKDDNGNKIWKNKIYFSAGNENDGIPLYIGMMTIKNKSNKDLTKNGSYRTQLRIKIKKLDDVHKNYDYKEMEGLHIEGTSNSKIWFVITPSGEYKGTKAKKKKLQYIYSIPRKTLNGSKKK